MRDTPAGTRLVALMLLLLGIAGSMNGMLLRYRSAYHLGAEEHLEDAPPLLVFTTVVLGGFRGMIADVLWLRASHLQDEERFLELVQLADWITKLEPHTTEVWAFHAWNLAYNVSVMLPVAEERWRWVAQAVKLLRDDGLRYHGGDPRLYGELAWLLQHKLGGRSDRMHGHYKMRWADAVGEFLPDGRFDYEAPVTEDVVRGLGAGMGLDRQRMRMVDALYGPLDWRVPQAHAVYWAYAGLEHTGPDGYLPCVRVLYQALADMVFRGRITGRSESGEPIMGPDARLVPVADRTFEQAIRDYPGAGIDVAHGNFLRGAVALLEREGRSGEARRLFDSLQARYPGPDLAAGFEHFLEAYTGAVP